MVYLGCIHHHWSSRDGGGHWADAAEPSGVVAHAAVFPEAMPATASPEVAADATEPPEAVVLSLIPCMVVVPSNAVTACYVTVK